MSRRDPWTSGELAAFVRDYEAGVPERELLRRFPGKTVGQFRGKAISLQLHRPLKVGATVLPEAHAAVVEGRTLYPDRARAAGHAGDVLVTGRDQRKLGRRVTKGAWAGFPIFSLTLEERATCPRSCHMWRSCFAPGTPVLTADFRWVPIEQLSTGDRIAGFDEDRPTKSGHRMTRIAEVEGVELSMRPCYLLETDKGKVVASADHLWLMRRTRLNYKWRQTDKLRIGDKLQFFKEPWEEDFSYDAGRLRGFVEGEGHCSVTGNAGFSKSQVGWTQRPSKLCDEIDEAAHRLGFRIYSWKTVGGVNRNCEIRQTQIRGGWRGTVEFLGRIRPTRMIEKSEQIWVNHSIGGRGGRFAIVTGLKFLGQRKVVKIKTSTATLVAAGFFTHNCMGNGMQFSARNSAGPELERKLRTELARLQRLNPDGFAVRLHILGDFYSVGYVEAWGRWLEQFPALHVWGYTAWPPSTPIGGAVARLLSDFDRAAIRLSTDEPGPGHALTLPEMPVSPRSGVIVCPAELGQTKGCNSCALCWSPAAYNKTIAFLAHGAHGRRSGAA